MQESKKIKEEFGLLSEKEAVKEYTCLHNDFMHANYPLIADELVCRLDSELDMVLDVGTGPGTLACEFAKRLPLASVVGIDISQEMIDQARLLVKNEEVDNLNFEVGDAHCLKFPDNHFDLVVSFGVLHHMQNLKTVFLEIRRMLKDSGVCFIYDLRKDAPSDVVREVADGMPSSYRKAFLESVKEAYESSFIEEIVRSAGVTEFRISGVEFSRSTLIRNKEVLRKSKYMGKQFNNLLTQIYLKK